jgi:hypothetical protein
VLKAGVLMKGFYAICFINFQEKRASSNTREREREREREISLELTTNRGVLKEAGKVAVFVSILTFFY